MKMEKARKKQLASGTRIKTAEQMEQDAMNGTFCGHFLSY